MAKTLYGVYVPMTGEVLLGENTGPVIFQVGVTSDQGEFLLLNRKSAKAVWGDEKVHFPFDRIRSDRTYRELASAIFRLIEVLEDEKDRLEKEQMALSKQVSSLFDLYDRECLK